MQQLATIPELLNMRNVLAERQRELYVATITNINMRYRELLTDDFGATLVKNCAWDAADAIVDRYFNTKDYYISTQQMYERICSFSYGNETDPLSDNTSIRKMLYENTNSRETLDEIARNSLQAQKKLFEKEDGRYKDHAMMTKAKQEYRQSKQGDLRDELTGTPQAKLDRPLEVDHTQAAATATYNSRYIKDPEAIEQLKKFYNSPSNFQMLQKSANASKSDVKVFSDGKKTISETAAFQEKRQRTDELRRQYQRDGMSQKDALKAARDEAQKELFGEGGKYTDITYKATAAQRTQATVEKWENANPTAKETLKRDGFLDENGKVKPEVKKELEEHYRNAMNGESRAMRPDYHAIAKDSMNAAKKSIKKIIIGQVVYYVLPPLVFETRTLVRRKNMTLDVFFQEIKKSGRRIIRYVSKKLGDIFKNIAGNLFNKFLKSFFDILIELAKETVKRVLKVVKQLVLSLVNCVKIIADKNTSSAQKADSVSKLMAATVTTIALEILFEWMEKQFGLPDILMEPLQIIVTIIVTNVIMLILQKADLFDVQYGLLVSNIQMIFEQEQQAYLEESSRLEKRSEEEAKAYMEMLNKQISDLEDSLDGFDPFKDDAGEDLEKLNEIYQMDIDFKKEWLDFCNSHPAVGVY
ncbi:MAG TPA: hypothetical protein H9698_03220 [Candidatus Ruthenibacterium merdavium]|uniref:Uncharacterized protein n=1 Tax=Candidatus Ruthenibacterium merdavium TaxID=2838752 RepID=A0A9D2Q5E4_9FIRM|nr:hypothetical protein [Candidatus Ruthenibacterium merdavium]